MALLRHACISIVYVLHFAVVVPPSITNYGTGTLQQKALFICTQLNLTVRPAGTAIQMQNWESAMATKRLEAGNRLLVFDQVEMMVERQSNPMDFTVLERENMVRAGLFGLRECIADFDEPLGRRFSTFAINGIQKSLVRYMSHDCMIR